MRGLNKLRYTGVPAVPRLLHRSVPVERYGVLFAYLYFLLYYGFNQDVLRVLLSQDYLTNRRFSCETVPQPVIPTIEDIISPQNSSAKLNIHRRFSCLWCRFTVLSVAGESSVQENLLWNCTAASNSDYRGHHFHPKHYCVISIPQKVLLSVVSFHSIICRGTT